MRQKQQTNFRWKGHLKSLLKGHLLWTFSAFSSTCSISSNLSVLRDPVIIRAIWHCFTIFKMWDNSAWVIYQDTLIDDWNPLAICQLCVVWWERYNDAWILWKGPTNPWNISSRIIHLKTLWYLWTILWIRNYFMIFDYSFHTICGFWSILLTFWKFWSVFVKFR